MRIALDAMGGDYAPGSIIEGAVLGLKALPEIEKLFLVGDTRAIGNELKRLDFQDPRVEIYQASEVVSMQDSAAKAVRHKKDASICRAVDLVKNGSAHAVVSAGHTGAAVAACVLKLRTLKGIERPAVACLLPSQRNIFVLIDGGANPDSTPDNLVQFAIMGSVFSKHVLGYKNPSVALMSIGEEDTKGNDVTKEAFKLLKVSSLNFRGNIEGHDLFENPSDVVVCDGFTGNVVLKTSEAIAHAIFSWLKHELFLNPLRRLGAKLAEGAFKSIRKKTNYEEYGGMPLLGVNGVCIIAHGASSALAIKNAIRVATESIKHEINPQIVREVQSYNEKIAAPATPFG
ncbi:MAG: phosphate acyltransferase PlsX [Verrucomicrobia bacterium]|nr:phosphate acyltransferase PlsX [Verrucomicrobiota bacterium]MBV8376314.1 phosphate acyltransferase PlsX [Verrucomicrobiota bacterium]